MKKLTRYFDSLFSGITFAAALLALSLTSCDSDDGNQTTTAEELGKVKLQDFPLNEVEYLDIEITHPKIEDNEETESGEITITIPYSRQSLTLSLKSFGLDDDHYSISPAAGIPQDFSKGPVTYTISVNSAANKTVSYQVSVEHGGDPFFINALITGFKFEKSKNPALAETIDGEIVIYENYSENAIYVTVPQGTDFTKLVPTVTYDAAKLYYLIDETYIVYPTNNLTVDFKYPKRFQLQAENSLGEKSRVFHVIVNVKDPIQFQENPATTVNVKTGTGTQSEFFSEVIKWTNVGNYPIAGMAPFEYKNKTYPVEGLDVNIITSSLVGAVGGAPGVLPGETGQVTATVKRVPFSGLYSTTVVFRPTFLFDTKRITAWQAGDRIESLFNPAELTIKSTQED